MEYVTDKTHTCLDLAMSASDAKDRKEVGKARVHYQLHLLDDGDHVYNGLGDDQQFKQQQQRTLCAVMIPFQSIISSRQRLN